MSKIIITVLVDGERIARSETNLTQSIPDEPSNRPAEINDITRSLRSLAYSLENPVTAGWRSA